MWDQLVDDWLTDFPSATFQKNEKWLNYVTADNDMEKIQIDINQHLASRVRDWIVKLNRDLGTETENLDIVRVKLIIVTAPWEWEWWEGEGEGFQKNFF